MHFHLSITPAEPQRAHLLLDGVDITHAVLADGFAIDFTDIDHPVVSMKVRPDSLTVEGEVVVDAALIQRTDNSPTDTEQEDS